MLGVVDDRALKLTLAGKEYDLLLNVGAIQEITRKYGGLEEAMTVITDFDTNPNAWDDIIFLITTLINQGTKLHNFMNPEERRDMVSEEVVSLAMPFTDILKYVRLITAAVSVGTMRKVAADEKKTTMSQ